MKVILTISFVACCILVLTNCLPISTQRSSQSSWPCQRDEYVRTLLSDASSVSLNLAGRISLLSKIMAKKWPTDPNKESNVNFFAPRQKFNRTKYKPEQILRANCRILRAFISLMNNSTKQLKRFQVTEGLVTSKLVDLKLQTKSLITYLKRIVKVIKFQRQGNSSAPQNGEQKRNNNSKPATQPVNTAAIQDVILQTKLILDDFNANLLTLAVDLLKIKGLTCY